MIVVPHQDVDPVDLEALEKLIKDLGLPVHRVGCATRPLLALPGATAGELLLRELKATGLVERVVSLSAGEESIELTSRRTFLDYVVGGTLIAAAHAVGFSLFAFAKPPRRKAASRDEVVVHKSRFAHGNAVSFQLGGHPGIVVRDGATFYALSAICTHKDTCQLSWSPDRHRLICPCHNGAFDLQGNVVDGPPPRPLQSYRVSVIGNAVHVRR